MVRFNPMNRQRIHRDYRDNHGASHADEKHHRNDKTNDEPKVCPKALTQPVEGTRPISFSAPVALRWSLTAAVLISAEFDVSAHGGLFAQVGLA